MYITINNAKGEKRIDLSYPTCSGREVPEGLRTAEDQLGNQKEVNKKHHSEESLKEPN